MKTQITIILAIILSLTLVQATTIIAGENHTLEFSGAVSDCKIIENEFNTEGLELVLVDNKVIIITEPNFKPDTFKVSCMVEGTREEEEESYGGSTGRYNYAECGGWCDQPLKTIIDTNITINETEEPVIEEPVVNDSIDMELEIVEDKKFPLIIIIIIILVIVVGIIIIIISRSKDKYEPFEEFPTNIDKNFEGDKIS